MREFDVAIFEIDCIDKPVIRHITIKMPDTSDINYQTIYNAIQQEYKNYFSTGYFKYRELISWSFIENNKKRTI